MYTNQDLFRLLSPQPDRPTTVGPGTDRFVGKVVTANSAISVGTFLTVTPVSILGSETEGATGLISMPAPSTVPVYLVGPHLAQQGEMVICRFVNHRWVTDRGGTTPQGHTIIGCPCTAIPDTLYLHVQHQPGNGVVSFAFPATLRWQPKPAPLATYQADPIGYYSTTSFQSSNGFFEFYYWLTCKSTLGIYYLSGLMTPDSLLGFPTQFIIMTWLVGLPGNTCTPFWLHNGAPNNTTYRDQVITLDGSSS